jgi:hypothetical protein
MASITDLDVAGACDVCRGRTEHLHDLQLRAGDKVCKRCDALFTAAHALLDNDIPDEPTVPGTLAFARSGGAQDASLKDYCGLEYVSSVDGVPLLRLPRIKASVTDYDGSGIPKAAIMDVYSRDVKPPELAGVYESLLEDHGIHSDKCSGGSVTWDAGDASLTLAVRPMKHLHPDRAAILDTYPSGRVYSFPPSMLVRDFYRSLLGSTDSRTFAGYAYALAKNGRHMPLKAVTGSVAWLLGERDEADKAIPPRERRPRIAKILNTHLLAPRDEQELPEGYWTPEDTVWRDASTLGQRLLRNLCLVRERGKQRFPQSTV